MLQTCHWTGECSSTGPESCVDKCVANLWPLDQVNPALNGVAYQNDAFYGLCPELALLVERARVGWPALFASPVTASDVDGLGLVRTHGHVARRCAMPLAVHTFMCLLNSQEVAGGALCNTRPCGAWRAAAAPVFVASVCGDSSSSRSPRCIEALLARHA